MKLASELMNRQLATCSADATLQEAHDLMEQKHTHHVLITDAEDKLVGILSDRDIKKFVSPFAGSQLETARDKATLALKVKNIMSRNAVTISPQKSIKACITKMLENNIHSLPVLDEHGKLIGIVTATDVFKFVLEVI